MKKKIFLSILILLLILGITSVYLISEYRTKNLAEDLLNTENLEELNKITIIDDYEDENSRTIDESNPSFPILINFLENTNVKRDDKVDFSNMEGYTFIIHHNDTVYHISVNENGALTFGDGNFYKIQDRESIEDLFQQLK